VQTHLIRTCCNSGWCYEPLLETVALESRPLFQVLRHRMSSPPIYLFEVIHKPFALSRVFLLSIISTYVDIRATYVAQTYLPLVHNFYPYAEQQPILVDEQTSIGSYTNHYWLIPLTYIGRHADQYRLLPLSSISPLVTCCKRSYFSELLYGENGHVCCDLYTHSPSQNGTVLRAKTLRTVI